MMSSYTLKDMYEKTLKDLPYIFFRVNNVTIWKDNMKTPNPEPVVRKFVYNHPNLYVTNVTLKVVQQHHIMIYVECEEGEENVLSANQK